MFAFSFSFVCLSTASNYNGSPKLPLRFEKVEKNVFKSVDETYYVTKTGCKGAVCTGVGGSMYEASIRADQAVLASCTTFAPSLPIASF